MIVLKRSLAFKDGWNLKLNSVIEPISTVRLSSVRFIRSQKDESAQSQVHSFFDAASSSSRKVTETYALREYHIFIAFHSTVTI